MSDLVVVEVQGGTVVVQETSPAQTLEVFGLGPQGPQGEKGDKGDKGDIGDVTPEATAAKLAAQAAATSAQTSATSASTSATAAAGSATSASSSATSAGNSATAAANSATSAQTAATTATTKASEAVTSANSAAASATSAFTSAATATTKAGEAATSATNAAASATSASASAATATTKASEAATSATSAANSATSASGSAATATTKATEASASAASALTSANSATASKNAAALSETNAAASATTATTQASIATTKAGEAATSATSASTSATSASASATTATTKASEALTSATSAANSATSAGTSAATATTKAAEAAASAASVLTSETNAAASAASALTSKNAAAASASSASTSETNAAASASTATTQAGIATTKAGEAATSASNAATSASTATTKAAEASSSATSAATAQYAAEQARDQALAAFDNFDDKYLGEKSSDPTTDNDGNPLVVGALYFNTQPLSSGGGMKVYGGSGWLAAYASLSGALIAASNLSDLADASAARFNLGLGNVENKSSATIRGELTSSNVTTALGFTPYDAASLSTDLAPYLTSATAASTYLSQSSASSTYQPILTSGSNIKTVNGVSLLGSGNVQIDGGVTSFNTRTGAITLQSADVSGALGYTPVNPSSLAAVATSGSYNDLSNKPTLFSGAYADLTGKPTALSAFTNDSGFITSSALAPYLTSATAASTYQTQAGMSAYLTSATAASTYQTILVSGTSIKTINSTSLLGSGDIAIDGGATISEAAPTTRQGKLWYSTSEGVLKLYYDDGDSGQWVEPFAFTGPVLGGSGGGSSYTNEYILTGTTSNATETEIFVGGTAGSRVAIPTNKFVGYTVEIVAAGSGETAFFDVKSAARNSSGTLSDVGNVYETVVTRSSTGINVDARVTTGGLGIYVTGLAAKSISWRAVVKTQEI